MHKTPINFQCIEKLLSFCFNNKKYTIVLKKCNPSNNTQLASTCKLGRAICTEANSINLFINPN